MTEFQRGERLYIETVAVEFVRDMGTGLSIVKVGEDSRVVTSASLSREQG